MEKFLGKFKVIHELTEGFDAYFDAMQIPDVVRVEMRDNKEVVTALLAEGGDKYKEWNDYGNRQEEFIFTMGQHSETTTCGVKTTHLYTLNGDRLEGEHEVAGVKTTTARYFQGDQLVFEATGNGATMKTFFTKLSA